MWSPKELSAVASELKHAVPRLLPFHDVQIPNEEGLLQTPKESDNTMIEANGSTVA